MWVIYRFKMWPLWLCMSAKYAINILSEMHVPINLRFEQRNETGISVGIPLKAIHSPLILWQNILLLEYTSFWALFPCRFSSKVMDKNEMLCIYARSVRIGHTFLHVSPFRSIYKSLLFPYQYLELESTVCSVLANLWYYALLITTVIRIILTQ